MLPRLQRYAACRYNELELRWTTKETWVFQRTFNVSAAQLNYSAVDLLLTGVDTVAEISVDDVRLASTANAHRRARHLGRCMAPAALSAALRVPRRGAWRWRAAGRRKDGGGLPSAHPALAPTTPGRSHRALALPGSLEVSAGLRRRRERSACARREYRLPVKDALNNTAGEHTLKISISPAAAAAQASASAYPYKVPGSAPAHGAAPLCLAAAPQRSPSGGRGVRRLARPAG